MELRKQQAYIDLKNELDECRRLGTNLLIVTVPGTGMGRMIKEYALDVGPKTVKIISDDDQELGSYNLVNFDWATEGVLEKVEKIFKKCSVDQKIVVTVNYPNLLNTNELSRSFFVNHTYRKYYFGLRNEVDTRQLVKEINPDLSDKEIKEIYSLTGGLAQLTKYLSVNGVDSRDGVEIILTPVIQSISGVNAELLEKIGLKTKDEWQGKLLADLLSTDKTLTIKINFDLSFEEDGVLNKQKLSVAEKVLLEKIIANKGKLTKEEVSDIKWGEGKYDDYSDQAINKQMRRLDEKLEKYQIQTIPKVGFILKKK